MYLCVLSVLFSDAIPPPSPSWWQKGPHGVQVQAVLSKCLTWHKSTVLSTENNVWGVLCASPDPRSTYYPCHCHAVKQEPFCNGFLPGLLEGPLRAKFTAWNAAVFLGLFCAFVHSFIRSVRYSADTGEPPCDKAFPCLRAGCVWYRGSPERQIPGTWGHSRDAPAPLPVFSSPFTSHFYSYFSLSFPLHVHSLYKAVWSPVTFCSGMLHALTIFLPTTLSCPLFCHAYPLSSIVSLLFCHMCVHTPLRIGENTECFCLSMCVCL